MRLQLQLQLPLPLPLLSSSMCSSRATSFIFRLLNPSPLSTGFNFRVVSHHLLLFSRNMTEKSSETTNSAAAAAAVAVDVGGEVMVQYVVLRRDLIDTWPLGSIVTQGCHASVAAVWSHRHHPDTVAYVSDSNIDSMHKVTLEVKGEVQLRNLSEKLETGGIEHKVWMEQPENIPTCIATRPYPKSQVASFFKKLKLCK